MPLDPRHIAVRDGLIARAVHARKIAPSQEEQYRKLYEASPDATIHLLTAPVEEGGLMRGVAAALSPMPAPEDDAYPPEWLGTRTPGGTILWEGEGFAAATAQPDVARDPVTFEP